MNRQELTKLIGQQVAVTPHTYRVGRRGDQLGAEHLAEATLIAFVPDGEPFDAENDRFYARRDKAKRTWQVQLVGDGEITYRESRHVIAPWSDYVEARAAWQASTDAAARYKRAKDRNAADRREAATKILGALEVEGTIEPVAFGKTYRNDIVITLDGPTVAKLAGRLGLGEFDWPEWDDEAEIEKSKQEA